MKKAMSQQTRARMEEIIRDAVAAAGTLNTALTAMLMPGHGIPLSHTCGAVLDHDMIRLADFSMGWGAVAGRIVSEDAPGCLLAVRIPLGDIAWAAPEDGEVK